MDREMKITDQTYTAVGPLHGLPLVLIHGAMVSKESWLPQLESLSDSFRVIAVDLPGHGTLAHFPFSFSSASRIISLMIRRETTRPVLVAGLSLGGYAAIEFASSFPGLVQGLILSGCSPRLTGLLGLYLKTVGWLMKSGRLKSARGPAEERVLKMYPPELKGAAELQLKAGVFPGALGDIFQELAGRDYAARLIAYHRPVFLFNGELDKISRQGETGFMKSNPYIKAKVIPNAGHACSLDQPGLYNAAVRGIGEQIFNGDPGI